MEKQNERGKPQDAYTLKIHRLGRILTLAAVLSFFVPVAGIALIYGIKPDWAATSQAAVKVLMIFGVIGMTEFLSFTPILGPGASYLSFITGNIVTMKLPCATSALNAAGARPGSKKADIVSALAVGTSSIVSTLICTLGMVMISALHPLLSSDALKPGFSNMVPALIGAMSAPYLVKNPRISSLPMALAVFVTLLLGASFILRYDSWFSLLFIVITVAWAYFLYKRGKIGETKS